MYITPNSPISLAIAIGIGLLIGSERERRKGSGSQRGAAGMRTFALAALAASYLRDAAATPPAVDLAARVPFAVRAD